MPFLGGCLTLPASSHPSACTPLTSSSQKRTPAFWGALVSLSAKGGEEGLSHPAILSLGKCPLPAALAAEDGAPGAREDVAAAIWLL